MEEYSEMSRDLSCAIYEALNGQGSPFIDFECSDQCESAQAPGNI